MQLKQVSIERSCKPEARVRLCGEVSYDDGADRSEVYWFDVPEKYADYLSTSGNPWLVCLLPLAVTLGEPLRVTLPVDPVLFEGVQELMRIWKCWYPHLHVVPIEAELTDTGEPANPERTAAFFSGGVDSFFTVLRHNDPCASPTSRIRIDDLLCVWGFDVSLENAEAFRRMQESLGRAATELGKQLVDVATNLRTTRWGCTAWEPLAFPCATAALGLALEKRYARLLIASGRGYKDLRPRASHPLTDPLLSTSGTKVIHDGAAFDRLRKTERVARSDVAMRHLRVCWRSGTDQNCGACEKCYRVMLALEVLGALDRCLTFQGKKLELAKVARIFYDSSYSSLYVREVQALALQRGRKDIARAIGRCLKRSGRLNRWLLLLRALRTKRFFWRWAEPLERWSLAGSLR